MSAIKKFFSSFINASRGIGYTFRSELNFRVEMLAAFLVFVSMIFLPLEKWEITVLTLMVFLVLIMEILNTLLERLINIFRPRIEPQIGILKDLMAGAVLLSSILAAIIGMVIFWPYFFGF